MASSTAAATSPFLGTRLPEHSLAKAVGRFQARFGFGSKKSRPKKAKAPPTSDRPLWFPGAKAPEWLDGSLVGDYGFDPFGLGRPVEYLQFDFDSLDQNLAKNPSGDVIGTRTESVDVKSTPFQPYSEVFGLQRFRECELIHGRWAMLATLGALVVEWLTGVTWQDAGKVELVEGSSYLGLPLPFNITTLIWIEVLVIGYIEFQRNAELDPEKRLYPGGKYFDPLGLAADPEKKASLSSHPFLPEKAKFYGELEAAVDVVERACRLCVDVKKSLLSDKGRILEKNDQTPVTIADFGVQALISLELKRLFPSIPLVAEEDSGFLRSNSGDLQRVHGHDGNSLVNLVLTAVADKATGADDPLTSDVVLEAIDRGGKDAVSFDAQPATYWVLDPIDGTRGFLKGNDALYVVGLALVVDGKIVLGVMGCPNWKVDILSSGIHDRKTGDCETGIIMIAHEGCGTWTRRLFDGMDKFLSMQGGWQQCFVDSCYMVHEARFCIPDSQTWDLIPLSAFFSSTVDDTKDRDRGTILLLPTCCGSLCKYLMVASGRASVFILRARAQTSIKVWDHAVGVICIQEAGGKVTDWIGTELDHAADEAGRRIIYPSGGVLVTNGRLHNQLLEMISSNFRVIRHA